MKQRLLYAGLVSIMLASSCKKDLPASSESPATDLSDKVMTVARGNHCRLISDNRDGVYGNFFHYNNRGLVDEFKIDYYDGFPDIHRYTYDSWGRLKGGNVVYGFSGVSYDFRYEWLGNRLVRETWYEAGTQTIIDEIVNSYNARGQIISRRSIPYHVICTFNYDIFGFNRLVNMYVDNVLYLKEEYTFRQFNRNPLTTLKGLPVMPMFYDFMINNRWESSQKWTVYDNGTPEVIVDLDPGTVQMDLNQENLLTRVENFDRAVQASSSATFNYENCQCAPQKKVAVDPRTAKHTRAMANFRRALVPGQWQNIKREIQKLKRALQ